MLAKRRCPHTGIINYFIEPEPFLAIGSISETARSEAFIWRCYIGEEAAGLSADIESAETHLAGVLLSEIGDPSIPGRTRGRPEALAVDPLRARTVSLRKGLSRLHVRGALPCR
jgi:hypothetical protein